MYPSVRHKARKQGSVPVHQDKPLFPKARTFEETVRQSVKWAFVLTAIAFFVLAIGLCTAAEMRPCVSPMSDSYKNLCER